MVTVLLCILSTGCKRDLLEQSTEIITEEILFADSTLTVNFLNDLYAQTGQDVVVSRGQQGASINSFYGNDWANLDCLTSNSISYWNDPQSGWMTGSRTAASTPWTNYYGEFYRRIRMANLFVINVERTPISAALKTRLIAEARYLKAFMYFALVRVHGGIMLMPDTPMLIDDVVVYERDSYKDCIDYILRELEEAMVNLPRQSQQLSADYGRATVEACQALRARILITIASPLYNGNSIATSPEHRALLSYAENYDATLWQNAADACLSLINGGQFALVEDNRTRPGHGFWAQFIKGRRNSELIIPYMRPNSTEVESNQFPPSKGGGQPKNTPSENLVRAFGMRNGLPITDPNSGYDAQNPFENRDPRFYYSVIYNGARIFQSGFGTNLQVVNSYFDRVTGSPTRDGMQTYVTRSGYFNRKMANDSTGTSVTVERSLPVIRYAEILLGYAEALNELDRVEEAVTYVNRIRRRAGIAEGSNGRFGIPVGVSKSALRTIIQNEYRVEFFSEGHWYYDTRRWRTAEITEDEPVQGMRVVREANGSYSYETVNVILSNFLPAMYFAPIPQAEINKSATLIQNPGW